MVVHKALFKNICLIVITPKARRRSVYGLCRTEIGPGEPDPYFGGEGGSENRLSDAFQQLRRHLRPHHLDRLKL